MKLYFISPLEGPINGVKVISKHILNYLKAKKQLDICVIDTSQAKEYNDFGKFNFSKIFFIVNIFLSLIKVKKKDLVYMNFSTRGMSLYRDWLILRYLTLKKANITIHIHANGLELVKPFISKTVNRVKIVVINSKQKETLNGFRRLYLLENALPDFYNDNYEVFVNSKEKFQFLFMSNISIPKGINKLYEFCENIANKKLDYEVTICGGILDNYSKLKIQDISSKHSTFVKILDPIFDEKIKMEKYRENDFFLFLSDDDYEVYPLVYIEALMNGLSVITTKQIVSDEIISNGLGCYFDLDNVEKYLGYKIDNQKILELKQKNRSTFAEKYNFHNYIINLNKIIFDE